MRPIRMHFLLLAFLAATAGVSAQTDKWMLHGGFSYEFYSFANRYNASNDNFLLPMYGLTFGANYVLLHSNDQISLSVNPNGVIAYSGYSGVNFIAQAPVYLLGRFGAGATPYNEKKVGIGLGIGGAFHYVYSNMFTPVMNQNFMNPAAIGEITFHGRANYYSIRVHWNLLKSYRKWATTELALGNFGLSINYSF